MSLSRSTPDAAADHDVTATPDPGSKPPVHQGHGGTPGDRRDGGFTPPVGSTEAPDARPPNDFSVPCTSDTACEPFGVCSHVTNRCVECDPANPRCPTGFTCDGVLQRCTQICTSNGECNVLQPVCSGGRCVGCASDGDCSNNPIFPKCNVTRGTCAQCSTDQDCANRTLGAPGTPSVTTGLCVVGTCVECRADTDCSTPQHCNVQTDFCECRDSTECPHNSTCVSTGFGQRCEPVN